MITNLGSPNTTSQKVYASRTGSWHAPLALTAITPLELSRWDETFAIQDRDLLIPSHDSTRRTSQMEERRDPSNSPRGLADGAGVASTRKARRRTNT